MVSYIIRRLLMTVPLLLGITILAFLIMQLAPGDPTSLLIDPRIRSEDLVAYMEKYGLNEPIHIEYLQWMGNMLHRDFGSSLIRQRVQLTERLIARLPNTPLLP